MRYSELEKLLRGIGCTIEHEGANHTIWRSPVTGKTFPVSRHKTEDVPQGTLKSIQRASGLDKTESLQIKSQEGNKKNLQTGKRQHKKTTAKALA